MLGAPMRCPTHASDITMLAVCVNRTVNTDICRANEWCANHSAMREAHSAKRTMVHMSEVRAPATVSVRKVPASIKDSVGRGQAGTAARQSSDPAEKGPWRAPVHGH